MQGHCLGCGHLKLEARNLCLRCYDYARSQARRADIPLCEYLDRTTNLASPGRYHDRPYRHNKSGYRGCYPDHDKWRAAIRFHGKAIHLGRFAHLEQAQEAYQAALLRVRDGLHPLTDNDS